MAEHKLTPMFEQYMSIKAEYPDALLFFRMGDFYELFFEDAEITARELQIALTSRNPKADDRVPMCGVPHHAVEAYLSQLLEKGYKVAICDQIEDPKLAKGLVKRAVTRVLTPGTVLEDANLTAKTNNFLAALYWSKANSAGGLAWVDFSTGQWTGLHGKKEAELWQWAEKIAARELLLPEEQEAPKDGEHRRGFINRLPARSHFDYTGAAKRLLQAQGVADLHVLDLHDKRELVQACGAIVSYLLQTQKHDLGHLGQFRPMLLGKHLLIDDVTERNLEIFRRLDGKTGRGTLWNILDHTLTPMGGRLLQERLRQPWRERAPIEKTLDAVEHLFRRNQLRAGLRDQLKGVYDLERLSTRIFLGRATPKDFVSLRESLGALPMLRSMLEPDAPDTDDVAPLPEQLPDTQPETQPEAQPELLRSLLQEWDDLADYRRLLTNALADSPPHLVTEGGLFRRGYSPELDELILLAEDGESLLQEMLAREQESSGLAKLKLGFNKVFGYYLEVPASQADKAPYHFTRRQTLANCERFTTPQLKELEEKIVAAVEQRKNLEYAMFQELRDEVAKARPRFLFMAQLLAALDCWQALAETARRNDWTRPVLDAERSLEITAGRHPVVEAVQGAADFVPNDLRLDDHKRLLLITGPNMAGKSTVLRQTALLCILAQIGSFVPAKTARIGLVDRVFSRVGASDNLAQGQSTFMVEMTETARILRQATKRSLVILDEIGRGTSTFDGLALAWAVVEDLAGRSGGVRTLFATHYHELTSLEGRIPGVCNLNIAVKEWGGDIIFLRKLVPGPADRSYGIEVAKLAGVPRGVVQRARDLLQELEQKARDSNERVRRVVSMQNLLPGLPTVTGPPPDEEEADAEALPHPLLDALHQLDIEQLTPLEALNLLHQWKGNWG